MIRVSDYLPDVIKVLEMYGVESEWIEITSSVQDWCHENGVEEQNPFRAAKCFLLPKRCHIVIQDEQTDAMIKSGKQCMVYDGFNSEVSELDTDYKYLLHLILHEVACFVLQNTEQKIRDEWAFSELHKHSD